MSEPGKIVGLPPKPFLYTLDQIAFLLDLSEQQVKRSYIHYEGRSVGVCPRTHMVARNIAPPGERLEWRVAERELIKWMRFKGFRYYERGYAQEAKRR